MIDGAAMHDNDNDAAGHTVPTPLVQQGASISDNGKEEEMMAMTAAITMATRCRKECQSDEKSHAMIMACRSSFLPNDSKS
jgi:hypothetical protein